MTAAHAQMYKCTPGVNSHKSARLTVTLHTHIKHIRFIHAPHMRRVLTRVVWLDHCVGISLSTDSHTHTQMNDFASSDLCGVGRIVSSRTNTSVECFRKLKTRVDIYLCENQHFLLRVRAAKGCSLEWPMEKWNIPAQCLLPQAKRYCCGWKMFSLPHTVIFNPHLVSTCSLGVLIPMEQKRFLFVFENINAECYCQMDYIYIPTSWRCVLKNCIHKYYILQNHQ